MGNASCATQSGLTSQDAFLTAQGWEKATRTALPGDFSSRHYVRLNDGARKVLLMVMPKVQELKPFLNMQAALAKAGARVPAVYAADEQNGFALIEDLGADDFNALLRMGRNPETLYPIAVSALVHIHKTMFSGDGLPVFTPALFLKQVQLFIEVYETVVLRKPFSENAKKDFDAAWLPALEIACAVPQSLMLRDFHAANIMFMETETGHKQAAMIDFQDGGLGPVSYDLASLLEDARLDVSPELQVQMMEYYLSRNPAMDKNAFKLSYALLASQRHMRVLAILARRWATLGDAAMGDYFKRSWRLLMQHKNVPALNAVFDWIEKHVPVDAREGWKP